MCLFIAMKEGMPCPCCESGMKSHQWATLSGSVGDYLLSTEVSCVKAPQAQALRGMPNLWPHAHPCCQRSPTRYQAGDCHRSGSHV